MKRSLESLCSVSLAEKEMGIARAQTLHTVANQEISREFVNIEGFAACQTVSTEDNKRCCVDEQDNRED